MLALPGLLTVYLSFNAGGFFVGATAVVAVVLSLVLLLRTTLVKRPFAGVRGPVAFVAGTLALFAAWTLLSAVWSDSPARALLEFDRALLYLLTLVLFASLGSSDSRLTWVLRGLAVGIVVVCGIGLLTRIAPDLWPISASIENDRLSYPLSYWNAFGLLAVVGIMLCLHLAVSEDEHPVSRGLGAAAVPILTSALLLTFSRGPVVALAVALVAYALVGQPRSLLSGVLAAGPPTAIAAVVTYRADLLAADDFTTPAAIAQGHRLGVVLALCALAAGLIRMALYPLDRRLAAIQVGRGGRRWALGGALAVLAVVVAAALALGVPGYAERSFERFLAPEASVNVGDPRGRLLNPDNNGRLDQWKLALEAFEDAPLLGHGAGTYPLLWTQRTRASFPINDGHSLYLEVMSELGLVGLVLLGAGIVVLLFGLLRRARAGKDRSPHAVVFALALAWAAHAGIDWDWEVPAVTLWLFALGGLGLSAAVDSDVEKPVMPRLGRGALGFALLLLALTPAAAALSQDRLDRSRMAFKRGDCATSIDAALDSISVLGVRPEPWELLGYCDVRVGQHRLAVRALENAVERDPDNWEFHYGLALVRGAAGVDPRGAALQARRLAPREPLAQAAVKLFSTGDRRAWRRRALAARLRVP